MSDSEALLLRNDIKEDLAQRDVYIWGAGQQGRGMQQLLERQQISIAGFIESSETLQGTQALGHTVFTPEQALVRPAGSRRPFVITAAFYYEDEIAEMCEGFGLKSQADFVSYKMMKSHDYIVEVAGACNLKCISCPRAGRFDLHPKTGMMSLDTFEKVLAKIRREDPFVSSLQLYQWGEPLLNPALAGIIRHCNSHQIPTALSTNLNDIRNLEPVMKARPERFRISVSGTGEQYEQTHTGGKWSKFEANFREYARLCKEHHPDIKTEVYYHLYNHNLGKPLEEMKSLCDELGFELRPVWAYLISLDDILMHLEGRPLGEPARKAANLLSLSLEDALDMARAERDKECMVLRCVQIDWDLRVANCMMYFYPQDNVAAANFLNTPLADIIEARDNSNLCRRCTKQGLHRYCSVVSTAQVALPMVG